VAVKLEQSAEPQATTNPTSWPVLADLDGLETAGRCLSLGDFSRREHDQIFESGPGTSMRPPGKKAAFAAGRKVRGVGWFDLGDFKGWLLDLREERGNKDEK